MSWAYGARFKGFFAEVRSATRNEGYIGARSRSPRGPEVHPVVFCRGRGDALHPPSRSGLGAGYGTSPVPHAGILNSPQRVLVKARIVRHRGLRSATLSGHVRYLKRDGVTRTGETAAHVDPRDRPIARTGIRKRCRDDRHHFRLIMSPDDAAEMTDLRALARELVADMGRDLGTKLDWIAVDHYNNDNPHSYILIRRKADDVRDLVIGRDYIGCGIRARAQDRVSVVPEPRAEHEIRALLEREVRADRRTQLDTVLRREADESSFVDLRPVEPGRTAAASRRFGNPRPYDKEGWMWAPPSSTASSFRERLSLIES